MPPKLVWSLRKIETMWIRSLIYPALKINSTVSNPESFSIVLPVGLRRCGGGQADEVRLRSAVVQPRVRRWGGGRMHDCSALINNNVDMINIDMAKLIQ